MGLLERPYIKFHNSIYVYLKQMPLSKTVKLAHIYKNRPQKICIATGIHCHKQYFSFPYINNQLYGCFYNVPILLAWCKAKLSANDFKKVSDFYSDLGDIPVIDYHKIKAIKSIPAKKQELLKQLGNNMCVYAMWDFYIHPKGSTLYGVFASKKSNGL